MIIVRDATIEDVPFIKEMMWEAIEFSPVLIRDSGVRELRARQSAYWGQWHETNHPVFVATDEAGQKLGAIALRPYHDFRHGAPAVWELGIGVAVTARRQGVGQKLLEKAIEHCRKTNLPYLVLTVDPTNRLAQALYRKTNFKITSKRYGVIEMRFFIKPLPTENPETIANRRYFLHYWPKSEYRANRYRLHHCSPHWLEHKDFRKAGLKPKDWVYLVSVIKGSLHLVAKYEVEEVLSYEEAKAKYPKTEGLTPNADAVIAGWSTLYSFEPPIDEAVAHSLKLLDKGRASPFPLNAEGQLSGPPLRGIREITPDSACLLDGFVEIFRS